MNNIDCNSNIALQRMYNVSSNRLPYLTVLLRFGTRDVVDAQRNGREGVYIPVQ